LVPGVTPERVTSSQDSFSFSRFNKRRIQGAVPAACSGKRTNHN